VCDIVKLEFLDFVSAANLETSNVSEKKSQRHNVNCNVLLPSYTLNYMFEVFSTRPNLTIRCKLVGCVLRVCMCVCMCVCVLMLWWCSVYVSVWY
jgi:hypothetical protein